VKEEKAQRMKEFKRKNPTVEKIDSGSETDESIREIKNKGKKKYAKIDLSTLNDKQIANLTLL